jgi:hypothetical protein
MYTTEVPGAPDVPGEGKVKLTKQQNKQTNKKIHFNLNKFYFSFFFPFFPFKKLN